MSDIFPKWTNKLPAMVIVGGMIVGGVVTAGLTYYMTPKYARVGYTPVQPVAFSHAIHADQLGLDCRYCHNGVEKSWYSNVPAASTCMNFHKTPDFVYFNHAVHVNRGVSCVHCHGPVNKMDEVRHSKSLGMAFCLECHRDPAAKIRPNDQVFNLDWQAPEGFAKSGGAKLVKDWNVHPGESCSVCHR